MRYEHYFQLKQSIPTIQPEVLKVVEKIFDKHADKICADSDFPNDLPHYTDWEIYFNGKGKQGQEAFCFPPPRNIKTFSVKTGMKDYDIVVCQVLMVLKYFYKNLIRINTTGDSISWHKSLKEITEFLPNARFLIHKNSLLLI